MSNIVTLEPFASLQDAIQHLLSRMQSQTPLKTWVFSEVVGNDWKILACVDPVFNLQVGHVIPWSDSVCWRMLLADGPLYAGNLGTVPDFAAAPIVRELGLNSYFGLPLAISGHMQGMLCGFAREEVGHDLAQHVPLADTVGRTILTFWQQKLRRDADRSKLDQLRREAVTDPLTGLLNRRGLRNHIRRVRPDDSALEPFAMIVVDLDGLKAVNDRFGHDAGDALITGAAQAMRSVLRVNDAVARIGGDEFSIYLPLREVAQLDEMIERIEVGLASQNVSATLGYSWSDGSVPPDYVYRRADHHLIAQKRRKKAGGQGTIAPLPDPNQTTQVSSGAR